MFVSFPSYYVYFISYDFNEGEDQKTGGNMLVDWYVSEGIENRPETYEVYSWLFMIQNCVRNCVVRADSLEMIWKLWNPYRNLMDMIIQPS